MEPCIILEDVVTKILETMQLGKSAEDSFAIVSEHYPPEAIKAAMTLIKGRVERGTLNLNFPI
ncbi:hypothetical protein GS682_32480 [Nostoc sp. B(2019)]|nr:hypothetical protein [Nostoc sp. B(2019)]